MADEVVHVGRETVAEGVVERREGEEAGEAGVRAPKQRADGRYEIAYTDWRDDEGIMEMEATAIESKSIMECG